MSSCIWRVSWDLPRTGARGSDRWPEGTDGVKASSWRMARGEMGGWGGVKWHIFPQDSLTLEGRGPLVPLPFLASHLLHVWGHKSSLPLHACLLPCRRGEVHTHTSHTNTNTHTPKWKKIPVSIAKWSNL